MNTILQEAYKKMFGKNPNGLKDWEIARSIMNNWNVPTLGEDLAKQVIFQIVNHVNFPSKEITTEVVLRAENMATELFEGEGLSNEPHMAEIARLEGKYNQEAQRIL